MTERGKFETWAISKGFSLFASHKNPQDYYYQATKDAWEVWQARAALDSPAVGVAGGSTYFASDRLREEFKTFGTMEDAKAEAEYMLDLAGDDACENGWEEGVPSINYGIVLGVCVEIHRGPAPEGSDYDEHVEYALQDLHPPRHTDAVDVIAISHVISEMSETNEAPDVIIEGWREQLTRAIQDIPRPADAGKESDHIGDANEKVCDTSYPRPMTPSEWNELSEVIAKKGGV